MEAPVAKDEYGEALDATIAEVESMGVVVTEENNGRGKRGG